MTSRKRAWCEATGIAAAAALFLGTSPGLAASPPARAVVAYLVSANADDDDVEVPFESSPGRGPGPHPWQWRIFDPERKRDTLFLELPAFPTHIRWDRAFDSAAYVIGDRIERVAWRMGARPSVSATLPADSLLCDFWSDSSGAWHVVTQHEYETPSVEGRQFTLYAATRWDRDAAGVWRVGAVDSAAGGHYGECDWPDSLERGGSRPDAIRMDALLDSMLIGYHRDSTLREIEPSHGENADRWVFVPSEFDLSIGLEMNAGFGDSDHAMEPIEWVNRSRGLRQTLYPRGQSEGDTADQLGFAERAGFVLISSEYQSGSPAVANMRSGEVIFRVDRPSARAVWVPCPAGWPK